MKLSDMVSETASAGATASGGIAASPTGFASGGIGTRKRMGDMTETHVPGHDDHEVSMAHSDAKNLVKNSVHLHHLLKDIPEQQGLPGWVSAYITLANDYIESVTQYLSHHTAGAEHE